MENVEIIKMYFSRFLAGKITEAFELIDDNAVWRIKGSENVPTVGVWQGKGEISRFFQRFSDNFVPQEFNIQHYFPADNKVFVTGFFTHLVKPTEKYITSDWLIEFSVDNGKITGYKILEDSYGLYLSFLKD